jgi:hypothetical protein
MAFGPNGTWLIALALLTLGLALGHRLRRESTSSVLLGSIARVTISVPRNGMGLIALVVGSRRTTLPARSSDGLSLERGTEVVIVEVARRVAVVSPLQ